MVAWRKSVWVGSLAVTLLLANHMPAFSDAVWLPRLGYAPTSVKRVYLDVVTPEERKAAEKALKQQEKALKKVQKDTESVAETKPVKHKQSGLSERLNRQKQRKAELDAKKQKAPVEGDYYLFSLKSNRVLFKEPAELQVSDAKNGIAPYYIEFKEAPYEGVFDVAVRGSGHRTKSPLWVSDSIYWDAMQPVLQDITEAHCPQEKGKYRVLQQCYRLFIDNPQATTPVTNDRKPVVQGGWYVDNTPEQGVVKETIGISNTAQILLRLYAMNPKSNKYLALQGSNFAQSRYPDILDEANWGLQYLLTIQQPDGAFPVGIERSLAAGRELYTMQPTSSNATAHAVMALATASKTFREDDLGLAIKYLRAAEKGWRALAAQPQLAPESQLLASAALLQATGNATYADAFTAAKAKAKAIQPQTAMLLGDLAEGIPVQNSANDVSAGHVASLLPLLLQVEQHNPAAVTKTAQWVTELYGYEQVQLVRDPNLELVSAWIDPLQWMATKTGEVATRLGHRLEEEGILRPEAQVDSPRLRALETKEQQARQRMQAGYKALSLTLPEKALLAYTFALLNQSVGVTSPDDPENPKNSPAAPTSDPYAEPAGSIKSFYPKPL